MDETSAGAGALPRSQVRVKTVALIGAVGVALGIGAWVILGARLAWLLIVISVFIAAAFNHPVEWLARKLPRSVAIGTVMVLWLAAVVGIGFVFVPQLVHQAEQFADEAPALLQKVRQSSTFQQIDRRLHLEQRFKRLGQEPGGKLSGTVQPLVSAVGGVAKLVGGAVSIYFLVLFMLLSGGRLVRALLKEALPGRRERYALVLARMYRAIGGYLLGLMIIMVINATLTSIFLGVIGVPFYLPLGVLSGLGSLLPLIGAGLAGGLITIVALASGGLLQGALALAYYVVYQLFENHVIAPVVYRRTVKVNPLIVLAGLLVFGELGGVIGAILSVPLLATGQIALQELLAMRRERIGLPPPSQTQAPEVVHRPLPDAP